MEQADQTNIFCSRTEKALRDLEVCNGAGHHGIMHLYCLGGWRFESWFILLAMNAKNEECGLNEKTEARRATGIREENY